MNRALTARKKKELADFFQHTYQRALELDPRTLPDTADVVRALSTLRAGARLGYFEATGKWLDPTGKVSA